MICKDHPDNELNLEAPNTACNDCHTRAIIKRKALMINPSFKSRELVNEKGEIIKYGRRIRENLD